MMQFNLLPDIKLEYIRAQRNKRLVISISITAVAVSLFIMVTLLMVTMVFQKKYINDLSADITKSSNDLKNTKDLDKVLTVQNQLNSLTGLHEQKWDSTRIFTYIRAVTPSAASISTLDVDFDQQIMTITGAADSLSDVNKFVDTLKFTEYTLENDTKKAFSEVVLTSYGRADDGASYTVNLKFQPDIFSNTKNVTINVPDKVTTRSQTEKPTALFETIEKSEEQ